MTTQPLQADPWAVWVTHPADYPDPHLRDYWLGGGLALAPDGIHVLSGSHEGKVRLANLETGKIVREFTGHEKPVFCVAFSPDGSRALSGSEDQTVSLWDVKTGREVARFRAHTARITCVAFAPDGRRAASGSSDGTVRLWDLPPP